MKVRKRESEQVSTLHPTFSLSHFLTFKEKTQHLSVLPATVRLRSPTAPYFSLRILSQERLPPRIRFRFTGLRLFPILKIMAHCHGKSVGCIKKRRLFLKT